MAVVRLIAVLAVWCILLAGCGGNATDPLQATDPAPTALQPELPTTGHAPAFPRTASAPVEPGTFLPIRAGSELAFDLAYSKVLTSATTATFTSAPEPTGDEFSNAAYGIYRMRSFAQAETAELLLEWEGNPPNAGDCWIGLPDWSRGAWRWTQLPADSRISLSPQVISSEFHQCYIAVMVVSGDPVQLSQISLICEPAGMNEYTLFAPLSGLSSILIDMEGNMVKRWMSSYQPNSSVYLLDNGHLIRTCMLDDNFDSGGRLEEYDWGETLVWYCEDIPSTYALHHDIQPMSNGNILAIAERIVPMEDAILAGRDPETLDIDGLVLDCILEIKPLADNTSEIVWAWDLFDHLIQDFDPAADNYGIVADHPELLDINFDESHGLDYSHANSISYNAELDQVIINFRGTDEFYIIDHSTTTEEATGNSGGEYGRGGDFLYRWGNPKAYRQGADNDRQLFKQHDAEWIPKGYPGEGNLLVFNNGVEQERYSQVFEVAPPVLPDGTYAYSGGAFGPMLPAWIFAADPPELMYSTYMSSSQRLPNGNTFVCIAVDGRMIEVTSEGETVWEYISPYPWPGATNPVFKADRYYLFGPDFPIDP